MTAAKYLEDSYTTSFSAKLLRVERYENYIALWIDQTYFYPEGGGQPSDQGLIGTFQIESVQKFDGDILHLTAPANYDQALKCLGKSVECSVDFKRRLTLSQQHTGQHILSACAYNLWGIKTVGLHIGDDYVTVDFDQKLSDSKCLILETAANDIVFQNRIIRVHYPDEEALSKMPLRKKPKVSKDIRVIEIDGFDFSPCGGTHFERTAQVGLIKIKKTTPYKSGVRIEFGCGYYALAFMQQRNAVFNDLLQQFSATDTTLLQRSEQTFDQIKMLEQNNIALEKKLLAFEVERIFQHLDARKLYISDEGNCDMKALQTKSAALTAHGPISVILYTTQGEKIQFVLSQSDGVAQVALKQLFSDVLKPLGARGGGNEKAIQGAIEKTQWTAALLETLAQNFYK